MNRTQSRLPHRRPAAFGLTEVLVVLVIIGLLIAIALPLYLSSQNYARQRSCESNMGALYQAELAYKTRNRTFTTTLSTFSAQVGGMPQCPSGNAAYTATVTGSGPTEQVTIRCENTGAHIAGQKLQTSDGVVFVGVAP